jgi:glycogen synthase
VRHGLQRADRIVAPTHAMLEALRREYGPVDNALVIHNGRSPACFSSSKKEPLILSAGRLWDEAKNIASLDAIAAELPWPIHVAGDGGSVSHLQHLGKLPQEQLANWLGRARIYCLPARYEPFGLSVLEAALSGCALVLGDIPSLREVWDDAALYADPGNPQAVREQLMTLIESPLRRTVLANRAVARARDFTPQRMASEYLTAYRELDAQQERSEHLEHVLRYSSSHLHA